MQMTRMEKLKQLLYIKNNKTRRALLAGLSLLFLFSAYLTYALYERNRNWQAVNERLTELRPVLQEQLPAPWLERSQRLDTDMSQVIQESAAATGIQLRTLQADPANPAVYEIELQGTYHELIYFLTALEQQVPQGLPAVAEVKREGEHLAIHLSLTVLPEQGKANASERKRG